MWPKAESQELKMIFIGPPNIGMTSEKLKFGNYLFPQLMITVRCHSALVGARGALSITNEGKSGALFPPSIHSRESSRGVKHSLSGTVCMCASELGRLLLL